MNTLIKLCVDTLKSLAIICLSFMVTIKFVKFTTLKRLFKIDSKYNNEVAVRCILYKSIVDSLLKFTIIAFIANIIITLTSTFFSRYTK